MAAAPLPIAWLNGECVALADAQVSVMDRAYLFGDAIYEVVPVYDGQPFRLRQHLARMAHSLAAVRIRDPYDVAGWTEIVNTLIRRNGSGRMSVYLQISRGVGESRQHAFPDGLEPSVFGMCSPMPGPPAAALENGVAIVTAEDIRWARCDIKANSLLANVLLQRQAVDAGAEEAVLLRNGMLKEGASSSILVVTEGTLVAPPGEHGILPGTTRAFVLEMARLEGISIEERAISYTQMQSAQEIWLSSSTREVLAVCRMDDQPVGDGRPGPLWRRTHAQFQLNRPGGSVAP